MLSSLYYVCSFHTTLFIWRKLWPNLLSKAVQRCKEHMSRTVRYPGRSCPNPSRQRQDELGKWKSFVLWRLFLYWKGWPFFPRTLQGEQIFLCPGKGLAMRQLCLVCPNISSRPGQAAAAVFCPNSRSLQNFLPLDIKIGCTLDCPPGRVLMLMNVESGLSAPLGRGQRLIWLLPHRWVESRSPPLGLVRVYLLNVGHIVYNCSFWKHLYYQIAI